MAYLGLVPGEHSSGEWTRRGPITKTGNTLVRRHLIEAAWRYLSASRGRRGRAQAATRRTGPPGDRHRGQGPAAALSTLPALIGDAQAAAQSRGGGRP